MVDFIASAFIDVCGAFEQRPISIRKAAHLMDVDRRTIQRWFGQGLQKARFRGKVYTSRCALQAFGKIDTSIAVGSLSSRKKAAQDKADADALTALGV